MLENINQERYEKIKDNQYFLQELDVVNNKMKNGPDYYRHVIQNIDIDRSNPNNSYIMWINNKVDTINESAPVKITESHYSLPDIDTDFPPFIIESMIEYISAKYGEDCVAKIVTFGGMKARSAIKEVARNLEFCDFDVATKISQCIPDQAKVQDQMTENEEQSLIMFTLKYMPNSIKEFVRYENDEIVGDFAKIFELALDLENSYKSLGKHAAGLVIAPGPIEEYCPLVKAGDDLVAGFDMRDLEKIGLVKFDILSLAALEKLMGINELLKYGKFVEDRKSHYV